MILGKLYSRGLFILSIFSIFLFAPSAHAAVLDLHGQAWSSDIGWINFNCADTAAGCTNAYKVQYDDTTGNLSGAAWSSNIGWLSFNRVAPGAAGNPPNSDIGGGSGPIARINLSTGKVEGWARFLSNDGTGVNKWDGWVKLTSTGSDPVFGVTRAGNNITGAAWGSLNVGWINFCGTGFCVTVDASFDYTLANSGGISVTPGSSGSNTITRTFVSGTPVGVSLAASGLPAGASAAFTNNPCNPTCSSTLTISTTAATPIGSYTITVTGNPLNKTTTFTLNVTSVPFDYSLSKSGNITVTRGSSGSNTITRTLIAGTPVGVTLSVSGLPGASTSSFSNNPCNPTCSSTLTVTVPLSVSAGTYSLTVTGNPGSKSIAVTLTVNDPVLGVSCSGAPSSANIGDTVVWSASPLGGNGSYSYTWSGSEGLSGSSGSVSKVYASTGTKNASVRVVSGAQTTPFVACSNTIDIGSGPLPTGTFYITHDPLPEPNPTQAAAANCHANNPQCNIAADRHAHFARDIAIAQADSTPTRFTVHAVNGFNEPVIISVDHVERDDSTAPGQNSTNCPTGIANPCADGIGDGTPLNLPAPKNPKGFIFYFNGDFAKTVSDPIDPNSSANNVRFNAAVAGAEKGRYIVYLKGERQACHNAGNCTSGPADTYINQVLLVYGSTIPGYREQ